jgi:dUTP pyrophosphatase
MSGFTINSKKISKDLCRWFGIKPGKKSDKIKFPVLDNDFLTWAFLRGYFEGDGNIRKRSTTRITPDCRITSNSSSMLESISEFCGIKNNISKDTIDFTGTNAIDFLSKLYKDSNELFRLERKYEQYVEWNTTDYIGIIRKGSLRLPYCRVYKTCEEAIIPSKLRGSDVGLDLTIIKKSKELGEKTTLYDTCLKVVPAHGYYLKIYPRSSLSKSGYILSNSVGIIDPNYLGTLKISLTKVDETKPDIKLPFRCCQLIMDIKIEPEIEIVEDEDELETTERGEGGFGSSGL